MKDAYPIPTVNEIFDDLHGTRYFSKIDLKSSFHQIRLAPNAINHLHQHLRLTLATLANNNLTMNRFAMDSTSYLGQLIIPTGVAVDRAKIKAISSWLAPINVHQLQGFLGHASYYHCFVEGYTSIAAPLSSLLCKDSFILSDAVSATFEKLKQALTTTPILNLPNSNYSFTVETNASNFAMGAVLTQQGHPLAYFSKQFPPRIKNSSNLLRSDATTF